jgi:hypothetical protein
MLRETDHIHRSRYYSLHHTLPSCSPSDKSSLAENVVCSITFVWALLGLAIPAGMSKLRRRHAGSPWNADGWSGTTTRRVRSAYLKSPLQSPTHTRSLPVL